MKAMVLKEIGQTLVEEERPTPAPTGSEVLLRIGAAGVCGSDLKIARGKNRRATLPRVLGHEFAGEVIAVGPDVRTCKIGERKVAYMYIVCGECEYCMTGRENLCTNLHGFLGFDRDGGFADYALVPEANLLSLPETVSFQEAAILSDAAATSWHAVSTKARVRPGQVVVIVGLGGLGLHAVQCAEICGGNVIAIDSVEAKLATAREVGAKHVIDSSQSDFCEEVLGITAGKGADAVVTFRSQPEILASAVKCVRPDGIMVMVGYLEKGKSIAIDQKFVQNTEAQITGARGNTRKELADVIRLVAMKRLRPLIAKELRIGEVNQALDLLSLGEVTGRIVLVP